MNAVFYTTDILPWVSDIGEVPWPLLPVANRPLLDYWLETCVEHKVRQVQLILGDGADLVEEFVGDGSRWGLKIKYGFARAGEQPLDYLRATADRWDRGLLYIGEPFFLRRRQAFKPSGFKTLDACRYEVDGRIAFLFGKNGAEVKALLEGGSGSDRGLEQIHIHPFPINEVSAYFDLNMKMVSGEFKRYVTAGFSDTDGSSIGYNVLTPPSAHLCPPIMIGNDCRFGSLTTVGPRSIIGDHVIIDSHTVLKNCLILSDTYIGKNLEIVNKIVSGDRLISPDDGTVVEIADSWLVARNRPDMRTEDLVRYIILWFLALGLGALQLIPFCILCPLVLMSRSASFRREVFHDPHRGYIKLPVFRRSGERRSVICRLFRAGALDRFPWLLMALRGRLFVCGQPPMRHPEDDDLIKQLRHYYPAVFSYEDYSKETDRLVDSLWYAHIRSLFEDMKILIKTLLHRFFQVGK